MPSREPLALAARLLKGERAALSKAISLVESSATRSRPAANSLLTAALRGQANKPRLRMGISGPPGAGKSTLIEALGAEFVRRGHRLAVLAVDPSSQRSGGSILGDKTRMPTLSANTNAFIRPSPARGTLGGVARRTQDVMALCECAGYDRTIVETVGVGQSEVAVSRMVDLFVLLVPPGAGDELQGIKRGIMEICDLAIVTKADGQLRAPAREAARQLRAALKVLRPKSGSEVWSPRVLEVSALHATEDTRDRSGGVLSASGVADAIEEFHSLMVSSGQLEARRRAQAVDAVREEAWVRLVERLHGEGRADAVDDVLAAMAKDVAAGSRAISQAADEVAGALLDQWAPRSQSHSEAEDEAQLHWTDDLTFARRGSKA